MSRRAVQSKRKLEKNAAIGAASFSSTSAIELPVQGVAVKARSLEGLNRPSGAVLLICRHCGGRISVMPVKWPVAFTNGMRLSCVMCGREHGHSCAECEQAVAA